MCCLCRTAFLVGFTIRPLDTNVRSHNHKRLSVSHGDTSSSSSSDSDGDDRLTSKVKQLKIKSDRDVKAAAPSASDLKEAVNKLSLSHLAGPYSPVSATSAAMAVDPWSQRPILQASLTGTESMRVASSSHHHHRQPMQPSLTGGTVRARPRAYTPTNPVFSQTITPGNRVSRTHVTVNCDLQTERASSDTTHAESDAGQLSRSDSMSSIGGGFGGAFGGLRPAYSMTSIASSDSIPIAMAVTETMHAWFSRNDAAQTGDKKQSATK